MNPIISSHCRIRYPEMFSVGKFSIVDDFCYFSTRVRIGEYCHVAAGCTVAGGKDKIFSLGAFSGLSSGVRVWCESNDYVNDLITLTPQGVDIGAQAVKGDVVIGEMCGVGANTVIMPNNTIPEGVAIGALSFVPPNFPFKPWCVYAGNPVRLILPRNKDGVLAQVERLKAATRGMRKENE